MLAVDTSALMAIVLDELVGDACFQALKAEQTILISAGTLAEALIVAGRRNVASEMASFINGLGMTVLPVTEASARLVAAAYDRWGKGVHPARLNLGDCFAYAVAKEHGCKLLFIGRDFAQTDLPSVLP